MSDSISRQKVLATLDFADNALTDEERTVENYKELLAECIKVLPTAEKESCRCNTCVNNDDELSGECYECLKGIFDHYEKENKTEVENGRTND